MVIITNRKVDATLITQLSDEDTITLEITSGDTTIILASMYIDRQKTPRTRSDQGGRDPTTRKKSWSNHRDGQ